MKQNLLTTAILSICLSIGLTAQTTGLTDNFSNETNSFAIYTEGIGTFTTSELEITKTIANGELTIDYDWITNNGFNSIKITPPNGTTFDLSATGQGLSFEYSSTDAYKITIGYQGQTPGSYTGYLQVTNPGETKTFTVPASAIPSYSAIPFLQIIVNTGGGKALDNSDADGTIVIDNLVIGDGSFEVSPILPTTGLTDDFSNVTNSLAIYTAGIGTFTTSELEITKTIANGELTIDYDWITNNGFNSIKITPPNGTTFDLSATGQGLSFEYSSTDAYKITIGYQGQTPGSYIGYLEVTNPGETKTFTVPASAIPSYSAIPFLQIIVNTGGGQALDNSDADGNIEIDNLVIGDGSFQVHDGTTSNNVTWTGGTNTDWATAANWDINTVPSATDNVIIPDFATAPIIGATTGAEINNLTITETEGINITAGGSLIVNGTSSGDVTYNRTLGTDNWYLMSSPVVGQTYNDAYVTANSISGNGSNRGIAPYVTSDNSWDYMQASDVDATFTPGSGYSVKRNSPGDVSFTGTLNVADAGVDVTLTNTGNGFNLLGNPYTSHINSATFLANEGAVSETKTLWVWNQANGAYEVKTLGDAMLIAPAQGFFVKANEAGGTFNFAESNQAGSGGTFQKTEARPEMHLTLSNQSDVREAKIYYIENMTSGFDVGYEGELFNGVANPLAIYTHLVADSEGKNYQVQSLPDNDFENTIIPLGINAISGSSISIKASKNNFPEGMNIYLEDKQDNSFTLLEADANFNTTLENDLSGIGRFFLHTTSSTLSANDLAISNNLSIYSSNRETLRVVGVQNGTANLQIFSLLGKEILRSSFEGRGVNDIALPKLAPGVYIVKVKMQTGQLNKKIIIE